MGDVLVTDGVDTTNTSLLVEATVGTPDSTPHFEMPLKAPCFELPPVVTLAVVDVELATADDAIAVAAESLVEKVADILPDVGTTDAAIELDDGAGRPLVFKLNSPVNPVPLPPIDAAVAGAIFESVDVTLEPLLWSFDELIETTGLPPLPSALVRFTDLSLDAEVELTGLSLATEVELPSRNPLVATAINTLSKDDVTVVTALAPPAVVVDDALPVTEVTSIAKVLAPPAEVTIDDLVSPTTVADDVRPTDDVVAAEVLVPPGTAPPDLTPPPELALSPVDPDLPPPSPGLTLMPPELVKVALPLLEPLVLSADTFVELPVAERSSLVELPSFVEPVERSSLVEPPSFVEPPTFVELPVVERSSRVEPPSFVEPPTFVELLVVERSSRVEPPSFVELPW